MYNEIGQRTFLQNVITGSIAGSSVFVSTLPLDYIKQWRQSNYGFLDIRNTIKTNGYKVLFRGGLIGSSVIAPQIATKLGALSLLNSTISFNKYKKQNQVKRKMLLGFLAGYVDGFIFGPVLAIQGYQQFNSKATIKDSFNVIKQTSIIKYSYPLALRNAFYTMPVFGLVYPLQNILFKRKKDKTLLRHTSEIFISASILNIPGTLLCSPFDVIRAQQIKLIMNSKNMNNHTYNHKYNTHNNTLNIIKHIWNKNGFRGFYSGYASLYINFAMRFPLTLMVNEYLGIKLFT